LRRREAEEPKIALPVGSRAPRPCTCERAAV